MLDIDKNLHNHLAFRYIPKVNEIASAFKDYGVSYEVIDYGWCRDPIYTL